ncbi:MAG: DUF975 family protein [Eubacterium sp.]|nr:DUF975 family protein [Eubacterium sp.]
MELNRSAIKQQARELLKGRVLKLFFIMFIIGIITGAASGVSTSVSNINNAFDIPNSSGDINIGEYSDLDDVEEFFENQTEPSVSAPTAAAASIAGSLGGIIAFLLSPLNIMLIAVFLFLIKGQDLSFGDGLTYIFKNTFSKNYLNLILHQFLKGLFLGLLFMLFIIPGVIFYYKWYFSETILAENPAMEWKDAMDVSKKMTNNHKGELFVLDLSFILWGLLCIVTFGFASIYVGPYIKTTKALYFENFRQRGFANGEINPDDFYSQSKYQLPKQENYQSPQYQQPQYQAPVQPQYQAPAQPQYQAPAQPQYQAPAQPQYQQPQYYQPPVQPQQQPDRMPDEAIYNPLGAYAPQPAVPQPETESTNEQSFEQPDGEL